VPSSSPAFSASGGFDLVFANFTDQRLYLLGGAGSQGAGSQGAGPRALTGAPTRLDSSRAASLLSCGLFRSAGIVPPPAAAPATPAGVALSPRSLPRG
jgi:hypothetical protein